MFSVTKKIYAKQKLEEKENEMAVRLISASSEELSTLSGLDLMESIRVSGGRAVSAEVVAYQPPLVDGVSNGALAAALGADIIHFNHYDVNKPQITGFLSKPEGIAAWKAAGFDVSLSDEIEGPARKFLGSLGLGVTFKTLRERIGRVVGVSLEINEENSRAPQGRLATPETAAKAIEQGAAYITLIASADHSPETVSRNIEQLRKGLGNDVMLVAGRMPWGGSKPGAPDFMFPDEIELVIRAGANMVVLPAPGTMAKASIQNITESVEFAHNLGALVEITIGTSQESADEQTVRRLVLDSKLTGADLFDIGDGGYVGIAPPENILTFTMAIKGRRHTYLRMAS